MAVKILVVDDDDVAGGLSRDLLIEAGFDADLLTNSQDAVAQIKEKGYALVIMDILMPGVNGLTLLHRIKKDPQIKNTKVVMVSGKSFAADKKIALEYGASLFIPKPYSVEMFVQQIKEVLSRASQTMPAAQIPLAESLSAPDGLLQVNIWGCRGPGLPGNASNYGHKTACVSLDIGEHLLVFDAGSGMADLGKQIEARRQRQEVWLFMSHFHADHTEGLASFAPATRKDFTIHFSAAPDPDKSLQQLAQAAFESGPAAISSVQAKFELYELDEQSFDVLPGVKVMAFYANHPGTTLGFVVETKGRKFVYCPDSEIYGETTTALQDYDEKLGRICKGADLLIHDGRYTADDYHTLKNHGHSAAPSVVEFAGRNDVKRLLLFHHDSAYSDHVLDFLGAQASNAVAEKGYALQVALARDGVTLKF